MYHQTAYTQPSQYVYPSGSPIYPSGQVVPPPVGTVLPTVQTATTMPSSTAMIAGSLLGIALEVAVIYFAARAGARSGVRAAAR
jgi:hypothetical protein